MPVVKVEQQHLLLEDSKLLLKEPGPVLHSY